MSDARHAATPRDVRRRRAAWLLAIAAFVAFCWAFDWAWFKPLVQRHVAEHAARRIDFDELHLGLDRHLDPTVRLRGVTIGNAPWADSAAPLIKAGELQFVFAWKSLFDERGIVKRLVLRDAEVDLERQADGHRNWRLGDPDDTGPGKFRVLALEAERSRVRFVHQGIGFDMRARIDPLPSPVELRDHAGLPLTKRLVVQGTHAGRAFDLDTQVSDLIGFFDTGQAFALRGDARSASVRLQVEGLLTDVAMFGGADAQVRLEGARLADLAVVAPSLLDTRSLPATAFSATGLLRSAAGRSTLSTLQARLGDNALSGELSHRRGADAHDRPIWQAALTGDTLDAAALAHALGADAAPRADATARAAGPRDPLARADLALDLTLAKLLLPGTAPAERLQLHVALNDGRLAIEPLRFSIAGGSVDSTLHVDAPTGPDRQADPQGDVPAQTLTWRVTAQGLRAEKLLATLPDAERLTGRVDGQAAIHAKGSSLSAWLASANGSASIDVRDGSVADRLEAKLALSAGAVLRSAFSDHRQVPVHCATVALTLHDGVLRADRLVLSTDRIEVDGRGSLQLGKRSIDLLLTPRRKERALLALDRSIRIDGLWAKPTVRLVDRVDLPAAPGCTAR